MVSDDDYDEDITGLIEKPIITYTLPPMYQSKYRNSIQSAASHGKSAHKSLGVPKVTLKSPSEFLKKNSRIELKPSIDINHKHYHRKDYQHKLPSWEPIKRSKSANNSADLFKSSKNFKQENIFNVSQLKMKKRQIHNVNDNKDGKFLFLTRSEVQSVTKNHNKSKNLHVIKSAPLENTAKEEKNQRPDNWMEKKISQSTNKNIQLQNKISNKIYQSFTDSTKIMSEKTSGNKNLTGKIMPGASSLNEKIMVKSHEKKENACHRITENDRNELVIGMRKKWNEMMKQFQTLPFLTDTPPKAKRKAKIEKDLKQLERDIDLIEQHPYIYVYSDDENDD